MRRRGTNKMPSEEDMFDAQVDAWLREADPDFDFEAHCPCCNRHFAIPSEWCSVKEHGLCTSCLQFVQGLSDHVQEYREPTVAEALAEPSPGPAEVMVLKNKLRALLKTS